MSGTARGSEYSHMPTVGINGAGPVSCSIGRDHVIGSWPGEDDVIDRVGYGRSQYGAIFARPPKQNRLVILLADNTNGVVARQKDHQTSSLWEEASNWKSR